MPCNVTPHKFPGISESKISPCYLHKLHKNLLGKAITIPLGYSLLFISYRKTIFSELCITLQIYNSQTLCGLKLSEGHACSVYRATCVLKRHQENKPQIVTDRCKNNFQLRIIYKISGSLAISQILFIILIILHLPNTTITKVYGAQHNKTDKKG